MRRGLELLLGVGGVTGVAGVIAGGVRRDGVLGKCSGDCGVDGVVTAEEGGVMLSESSGIGTESDGRRLLFDRGMLERGEGEVEMGVVAGVVGGGGG